MVFDAPRASQRRAKFVSNAFGELHNPLCDEIHESAQRDTRNRKNGICAPNKYAAQWS
jgi:hypothetical protein